MTTNNENKLIPASTVLMIRDGIAGLEVFMVVRNHQIDFASGALVFPGGKVDKDDYDERLSQNTPLIIQMIIFYLLRLLQLGRVSKKQMFSLQKKKIMKKT